MAKVKWSHSGSSTQSGYTIYYETTYYDDGNLYVRTMNGSSGFIDEVSCEITITDINGKTILSPFTKGDIYVSDGIFRVNVTNAKAVRVLHKGSSQNILMVTYLEPSFDPFI